MELNAVIQACKNNSIKNQKSLYEYTYQELFHVSLRYTNGAQDADEVFNFSMLKIFKFIVQSNKEIDNYLGLCTRIIRMTAIDQYRNNLSPIIYNSSEQFENNEDRYFDDAFGRLDVEDIFKMIQSLPDKERLVFSMFEIDGFSHKEISVELDIKENHSKWLLHHSKKILKEKLNREGIKSYTI